MYPVMEARARPFVECIYEFGVKAPLSIWRLRASGSRDLSFPLRNRGCWYAGGRVSWTPKGILQTRGCGSSVAAEDLGLQPKKVGGGRYGAMRVSAFLSTFYFYVITGCKDL